MAVSQAALTDIPTLPCDLRNTRLLGRFGAVMDSDPLLCEPNDETGPLRP
jgi:hypothetical protein